jgi:hypothetical protein
MAGRMGFEPAVGRALGPQGLFELRDAIVPKVAPQYQQISDPAEVKKRGFPAGTILQLSPEGKMEVLQEPQATGPNPEDARKLENEFRDEFNDLTKDYRKQFDAYSRVVASAQDPSAAGDLSLIFNYMKILDPGSTVREGEFANAQNSGGIGPRIRAKYNSVLNGERLSADIRADFLDRSTRLFESAKGRADNVVRGYTERARRNGINPANVVWDFSAGIEAAPRNATSYIEEEMGANQNGTIRRP